jgi:plastocyanin
MKKSVDLKSRLFIGTSLLFAVLLISNSCSKSSYNNMYGTAGNPSNTGGSGGPGMNAVFIQGMAFNPSTITVSANTTITWTNKDAIGHTVTSDSGLFDSGTIGANGTYSYTFASSGTFTYHCKVHPTMTASVTVNDSSTPVTTPPATTPVTPPPVMTPGY